MSTPTLIPRTNNMLLPGREQAKDTIHSKRSRIDLFSGAGGMEVVLCLFAAIFRYRGNPAPAMRVLRRPNRGGKDKIMKNTINTINTINATNLTINQNISIGAGNGGNPGKSVPEDIKLSDLLSLLGNVNRAETTPTPKALREKKLENGTIESIAPFVETLDGTCKVYANGYAVYSNEIGTTVLWLPDCVSFTYQFDELKDAEKDYLPQRSEIGEDVMGSQPWFIAVMLRGDHRVEKNSMNRTGGRKDGSQSISMDEVTQREEQEAGWRPGCRFENPEEAYIRKEMMEEQLSKLTDKQRSVFLLYHREGYSQREIAELLGISQPTAREYLKAAEGKIRNKKIFF